MPKNRFEIGATWDSIDRGELRDELHSALQRQADVMLLREAQGVKYMRFGPYMGTVSGSAVTIGHGNDQIGPRDGYIWSIRRLTVTGLTTGGSPDTINFYRNNYDGGHPVWQLNGNSFGATFGKMEFALLGGEQLVAHSASLAATGSIALDGDIMEVPAVQVFKLL
jgi:hypothetical protein